MNGADFRTDVESCLAPSLRPGDVVILEPVATHQVKGVREAITQAGATLRDLPAYSPDLHPIDLAFSKLQSGLRKASARTLEKGNAAMTAALDACSPEECAHYFAHAGYDQLDMKTL